VKNIRNIFAKKLLNWYKSNQRNLPWRETKDPYKIWLSEIILQQTRVNQGLPYYERFVSTFPNVESLALAPEKQVLRLWQGLGYYSRARNLHASAIFVKNNLNGVFPDTFLGLKKLKGVGTYTAAAIASFAYNEKVPVVDGNVYRVLARIFGVDDDIASPSGQKKFFELAATLLPEHETDTYNQAIMEFGALQCVPANPDCSACPLKEACFAFMHEAQCLLPVKKKSSKKRERFFNYIVLLVGKKLVLSERKGNDIWNGLYEFPLQESKSLWNSEKQVQKAWPNLELRSIRASKIFKHVLSHQNIHACFWMAELDPKKEYPGKTFTIKQIQDLPKPVLISRFLEEYMD
jgi:A/G-specific adenine glycosylase